eukprot:jgi/Picre1/33185/NNA_008510.t1
MSANKGTTHTQESKVETEAWHEAVKKMALSALAAATVVTSTGIALPLEAQAGMLAADPVKNANALLRYALPIDNKPIRKIQKELEQISEDLRIPGSKSLGTVGKRVKYAASMLDKEEKNVRASFAPDSVKQGDEAIEKLRNGLNEFKTLVEAEDKQEVPIKQQEVLGYVGDIEQAMVKGFPFEVPSEYSNLPQLKGRASLEMKIKFKDLREDNATGGVMQIVVDGYNGTSSVQETLLESQQMVKGLKRMEQLDASHSKSWCKRFYPVYEETLEDNGRFNEQPVLPFNAFGTLAMARSEFEANSASSQVFFLLKESELTPTGSNLLDGRYAVFGYITEGADLPQRDAGGRHYKYCKVTKGLENLQAPKQ